MRYPYLRDDPANPVDIEAVDEGLRFAGPGGVSQTLPWHDIESVRLYFRLGTWMVWLLPFVGTPEYCCRISATSRGDFVVSSVYPRSATDHEAYREFVVGMHRYLLQNSTRQIELRAGVRWSFFIVCIVCYWPVMLLGLVFERDLSKAHIFHQLWRRNIPTRYHPGWLPERLLPPRETP